MAKASQTKSAAGMSMQEIMRLHKEESKEFRNIRAEKRKYDIIKDEVKTITKEFKEVVEEAKRNTERVEREKSAKKRAGKTRAAVKRGAAKQIVYSDGKFVNKGLEDAHDKSFTPEEQEHLEKELAGNRLKAVSSLGTHHIKYLVLYKLADELTDIKEGKIQSDFHDRFKALGSKPKTDLLSEIRTSLFTNEQRDYLNGLLQGLFKITENDSKGLFKHSEMEYVQIVMLAEATIRIVKHVLKFASNEEALTHMIKCSRKAHGIEEDEY